MDFPKIRATFVGAYVEKGAWTWQGVPNPPEKVELPIVTAVAAKVLANRMLVERGRLLAGLQHAFLAEAEAMPPRDPERFAYAMLQVVKYLYAANFPPLVIHEMSELAYALDDLLAGIPSPILEARAREAGNVTQRGEIWRIRANIASAADTLIQRFGAGKDKAFQEVAKTLSPIADIIARPGANLVDAVSRWHRQFSETECPDAPAQFIFDSRWDALDNAKAANPRLNDQAGARLFIDRALALGSRSNDKTADQKAAEKTYRLPKRK
ncbi:MAG: hypothetical protein J0I42_18020 [Bosea sp.]|uniref:hypothetical protein n=1 Tax=Bosea sp. (in: a-proteobacteria) TaxID=1871050 RepID=UPI001AD4A9EE|nr:hypothetical protein [Bosea sp. (in: a-proteobacteria)]MBN9453839.1 hypothetical protein [Bosea sp. (in: a-proteobacteria)]